MIALGTPVKITEVAYVVRRRREWYAPVRGNFEVPALEARGDDLGSPIAGSPARWLHPLRSDTNKGVIAMPAKGSGVVIGLERKQYGHSTGSSGGGSMFEDFDPGYFSPEGWIDLYVVRSDLRSKPFYVPESALEVIGQS